MLFRSVVLTNGGLTVLPAASTCNAMADSKTEFFVLATPNAIGETGNRSFAADQRGNIYQDGTGAVLAAPLVEAGTVRLLQ